MYQLLSTRRAGTFWKHSSWTQRHLEAVCAPARHSLPKSRRCPFAGFAKYVDSVISRREARATGTGLMHCPGTGLPHPWVTTACLKRTATPQRPSEHVIHAEKASTYQIAPFCIPLQKDVCVKIQIEEIGSCIPELLFDFKRTFPSFYPSDSLHEIWIHVFWM